MEKLKFILLLRSFGNTLQESDLVSRQRFRLFKITTLFALLVFALGICQVYAARLHQSISLYIICGLFIILFVNFFGLAIHKNAELAYITLMALTLALLHIISYGQGGVRNSGLFYLAALILTAYMLLGKRGGKVMAGVSILHVVYFYFIGLYTNWVDYSLIGTEPRMIDLDFLITGILSILLLTAQADYLEKSKNAITEDIKSKRDELTIKNAQLLNAQHDLEIKNKELEQKNKELEQFAYVASHDLQEPLRTTTSFVDLLQKQYKGKLDEKADKYFSFISDSSNRMRGLISDLLEYSRIGNKKEQQQVDCAGLMNHMLADLGTAITEAGAKITAGPLPVIPGYPVELKLLFQNLIVNAIKFRRKDTIPEIIISARDMDHAWQFSVSDNGIGIAKEHNERIFIIFQRLHTQNEYAGSGIGLSHCKKIVQLHKGKIWLESEPGNGATFYFTIPK